jgi:hypothetical protein
MSNAAKTPDEDDFQFNYVFFPFIVLTLSWSIRSQMNRLTNSLFAAENRPATEVVLPPQEGSSPFAKQPMDDLDGASQQQRTPWWATDKSQIYQNCVVHGFLVLILHRVGLLLTRRVQKTGSVLEQLFGMALLTIAVAFVVSSGDATGQAWKALVRSSIGNNGRRLPAQPDQTDGLSKTIEFASFSLVVPWVGLLSA